MRPVNKIQNHARRLVLTMILVGLISGAMLLLGPARLASAETVYPSWSYTGNLISVDDGGTATLLPNGKVLSVGRGAELYDPTTGTWSVTGHPNTADGNSTATLLQTGKVLFAGSSRKDTGDYQTSAELYDPTTGTWSSTGKPNIAAEGYTATLLTNGKVLLAGGCVSLVNDAGGVCIARSEAELYDPATGAWSNTGSLFRAYHTATLLTNGKVLVAGGGDFLFCDGCSSLNTAELYDPVTGTWSDTGNLISASDAGTATLLPNSKVLIVGDGVELYDPVTGTWSSANPPNFNYFYSATLLRNGKVLVLTATDYADVVVIAELYDPTGTWSVTASPNRVKAGLATLLANGKVLVTDGNTAELYDPGTNAIDDTQFFVRQQYADFLNREPDADGLAYWTNQISQCGSDAQCIHERRIDVSAAFFTSLEFQDSGYYVYRFYKASFGRQPNYSEFTSDRGKVIGGSDLESSKQAFADEWVQRPAFVAAYPITLSNTEVVNKLFDSAGLTASTYDPQRQQEIQAMNAGRSRALVLRDVIEIPDFKNIPEPNDPRYSQIKQTSQYNPAFVLMQYFGYFRRNVDQGGYDFWLDIVNNQQPNNYHGMVCSFITSREYQFRFGSVATHSNADCGQ